MKSDKSECFAEEKFSFLENDKFNMIQNCTVATVKVNCVLGCISKSVARRSREVIISLYLAFVRPLFEYWVHFWALYDKRKIDRLETLQGVDME